MIQSKMIMKMAAAAILMTLAACDGQKWSEKQVDSFMLVTQKDGPSLGYSPQSGVKILTVDGYAFKDLNRNDSLDAYEDWRLPAEERAADLASQLSIEEIAGLMLYSSHQALLDIISGKAEPSALLPMQMPADMTTVEQQQEDVPRDMRCYQDADGNTYDFAFGLNWQGVIHDARVEKYK